MSIAAQNDDPGQVQGAFRALADPTRRAILIHLAEREMTIGEVAGHFEMTRAAVRKHLTVLEDGNLIAVEPRGRERINSLAPEGLRCVADWVDYFSRFWDDRLADLKHAAENEERANND